jgi:acetylornithine deacetylase/succinyl-diaminopimelate desuccinylase-like protein
VIEDVKAGDLTDSSALTKDDHTRGRHALKNGEVAVVTLAAGAGSRWTQGAGVVKALNPFCRLGGRHRSFVETHLAKSRKTARECGTPLPHIFTTSYFSHEVTSRFLEEYHNFGYEGPLVLSEGKSIGLRMIPTVRDLRFAWEEMQQQTLDVQQQKVRDSLRIALIGWAQSAGEAADYTDNLPLQCLHPVGHWYEVPNLLRNGTLARLLEERPQLKTLVMHNIDTVGMNVDPALLGRHLASGAGLTFEVITRRLEDRGGGLARVNGQLRLVEGLAMPREEDEFHLTYYNSNTCWIDIDALLAAFKLTRADLTDEAKTTAAIRTLAAKMPTYITLKDVKKRWGHGQEDVFPVCQFEKLWVDMSQLPSIETRYLAVPRLRGQQLKEPAQLDGWLRDGSATYLESLCEWEPFLQEHRDALRCDVIAISDTGMVAPGIPTFGYGLRGIACCEVTLRGPKGDLHSGLFGGAVANPAAAISRLVASLHDAGGRVAIDGFYDQVRPLESWEREMWSGIPGAGDADFLKVTGSPTLFGEPGYSSAERTWARPTAEVNGIGSGYQGEGSKTVLPAEAFVKLSLRLVPDQCPEMIMQQVEAHLRQHCPPAVEIEIDNGHYGAPYITDPNSKYGLAAQAALRAAFNAEPVLIREGGSIPIVQTFRDILDTDTLLLGLALPDAQIHAPNENFPVENFEAGVRINQALLLELAK